MQAHFRRRAIEGSASREGPSDLWPYGDRRELYTQCLPVGPDKGLLGRELVRMTLP